MHNLIILLSLLALAVSSFLKWRVVASGALLGMFFVPTAFGEIVNELFSDAHRAFDQFVATMKSIWRGLFGLFERQTGSIRGNVRHRFTTDSFLTSHFWSRRCGFVAGHRAGLCRLCLAARAQGSRL
jgi:hypothetical protein